jgi:hypothetical protein
MLVGIGEPLVGNGEVTIIGLVTSVVVDIMVDEFVYGAESVMLVGIGEPLGGSGEVTRITLEDVVVLSTSVDESRTLVGTTAVEISEVEVVTIVELSEVTDEVGAAPDVLSSSLEVLVVSGIEVVTGGLDIEIVIVLSYSVV